MKLNRIMWGIVLLFIGGVLLLENFNVIEFYWRNVWKFWPVFLIIAGVNILFNKQKSQIGAIISISVMVIMLSFLFYKGQEPPTDRNWIGSHFNGDFENNDDNEDDSSETKELTLSEPFDGDSVKKVALKISGGGTSFSLDGPTDSLITADISKKGGNFSLSKVSSDTLQTLTFKTPNKGGKWSIGDGGGNDVDFKLNQSPVWDIALNMGAGEVNFDLTDYKVRSFKFEGGAVALDVKIGDLMTITDVVVKSGVADIKINVPTESGCRITTNTGLSVKDFTGFTKLDNGTYETPNYKTSLKKVFIRLDGGMSNFEVGRY
jgi:hypothetical protein